MRNSHKLIGIIYCAKRDTRRLCQSTSESVIGTVCINIVRMLN